MTEEVTVEGHWMVAAMDDRRLTMAIRTQAPGPIHHTEPDAVDDELGVDTGLLLRSYARRHGIEPAGLLMVADRPLSELTAERFGFPVEHVDMLVAEQEALAALVKEPGFLPDAQSGEVMQSTECLYIGQTGLAGWAAWIDIDSGDVRFEEQVDGYIGLGGPADDREALWHIQLAIHARKLVLPGVVRAVLLGGGFSRRIDERGLELVTEDIVMGAVKHGPQLQVPVKVLGIEDVLRHVKAPDAIRRQD